MNIAAKKGAGAKWWREIRARLASPDTDFDALAEEVHTLRGVRRSEAVARLGELVNPEARGNVTAAEAVGAVEILGRVVSREQETEGAGGATAALKDAQNHPWAEVSKVAKRAVGAILQWSVYPSTPFLPQFTAIQDAKNAEEWQKVEDVCEEVLGYLPFHAPSFLDLGYAVERQGRAEESYLAYLEAVRLRPSWAMASRFLAGSLMYLGRWEEAAGYYERTVALDDQDHWAAYCLGIAYERMERIDAAIASVVRATEIEENEARYWGWLSRVYGDSGRWEDSLNADRQLTRLDAQNPSAWTALGFALRMLGRHEESAEAYAEAFRLDPQDDGVRNLSGASLLRRGESEDGEKSSEGTEQAWEGVTRRLLASLESQDSEAKESETEGERQ